MSARTVGILAIVVIVLFGAVYLLNRGGSESASDSALLFPGLKDHINDIGQVRITDGGGTVTIARQDDDWIVPEKGGYHANTSALRQLLLALSEAHKLEQKTSNPDYYNRLGVAKPGTAGSTSVLIDASGAGGFEMSLLLGKPAQQKYRYVRIPDKPSSWLIDRNPDLPKGSGGWLSQNIIDIDASRIKSVTVSHADGETLHIHKDNADETNFTTDDIPAGRELSYPSIVNGMASVLSNLSLEDVRAAKAQGQSDASTTTTTFETFDGLQIDVTSTLRKDNSKDTSKDNSWIALHASAIDNGAAGKTDDAEASPAAAGAPPANETANETASETASAGTAASAAGDSDSGSAASADEASPAGEDKQDPAAEAAAINALVSGWQYQILDYKANQLTRRWDDILKAKK